MEVKPYVLDDQLCDECQGARCGGKFAPFFCANVTCLQVKSKFHYDFLNLCYTVLKLRTFYFILFFFNFLFKMKIKTFAEEFSFVNKLARCFDS